MELEVAETKTYRLSKLERLDPVTVYVTQFTEKAGKITFDCFGRAWSCYWPSMGKSTIQEFFLECENDYILGKLLSETKQTDFDEINEIASKKGFDIYVTSDVEVAMQSQDMAECFGDDWYMDLPRCHTSDYRYVSRIINAIKAAFQQELAAV